MPEDIDMLEGKTKYPQKFTLPGRPTAEELGEGEAYLGTGGMVEGTVKDPSELLYGQGLGPGGEPMEGMSPMDVIQRMEDLAARGEERLAPPGERPTGDEGVLDTSWEGREKFRGQFITEHMPWGDPTLINPREKLEIYLEEELPQVFEAFFAQHPSGAILWEDRDKLDADEKKQWLAKLRGVKTHVLGLWEERKKSGTAYLNDAMKFWADKAKTHETKVAKELEAMKKARGGGDKPLVKEMQNEKGEFNWHYWDAESKKFVDTGNPADKDPRYSDEVQWAIDFIERSMNTEFPNQPQIGLSFQASPQAMMKTDEFSQLMEMLRPKEDEPKATQALYNRAIQILEERFKAGKYAEKAPKGTKPSHERAPKEQGLPKAMPSPDKMGKPMKKPVGVRSFKHKTTQKRYWIGEDGVWHEIL